MNVQKFSTLRVKRYIINALSTVQWEYTLLLEWREVHALDHNPTSSFSSTVQMSTVHQVTTMLATSKNVLFLGHNHLLTTGTNDPTLYLLPESHRTSEGCAV